MQYSILKEIKPDRLDNNSMGNNRSQLSGSLGNPAVQVGTLVESCGVVCTP